MGESLLVSRCTLASAFLSAFASTSASHCRDASKLSRSSRSVFSSSSWSRKCPLLSMIRAAALLNGLDTRIVARDSTRVIRNFRHAGLERLFLTGSAAGVSPALAPKLRRMLARLHAGQSPEDMRLPGYRLHALKGERAGSYAVSVTGNWRIVFRFDGTDATDVDLVDYH